MNPEAIIVDLDGTISDYSHRKGYLNSTHVGERHDRVGQPDWERFNAASIDDKPIVEMTKLVRCMQNASNVKVIIMTGRSAKYRHITTQWLAIHRIKYDLLLMRDARDFRSDVDVKGELYRDKVFNQYKVLFVLEDRDKVVEMWRGLGLRCLQVCKGEY